MANISQWWANNPILYDLFSDVLIHHWEVLGSTIQILCTVFSEERVPLKPNRNPWMTPIIKSSLRAASEWSGRCSYHLPWLNWVELLCWLPLGDKNSSWYVGEMLHSMLATSQSRIHCYSSNLMQHHTHTTLFLESTGLLERSTFAVLEKIARVANDTRSRSFHKYWCFKGFWLTMANHLEMVAT